MADPLLLVDKLAGKGRRVLGPLQGLLVDGSCKTFGAGNKGAMATRLDLPADVVAALDRVPQARERFFALPEEQQADWLSWIDRARGQRGRAARTDDMIQRLAPGGPVTQAEVVEPAGPPERYWWLWLLPSCCS
jgi:hypothetical protein